MRSEVIVTFLLPLLALARTDLTGCTSSIAGPSLIWYVPGSCELCEIPDCGGGRAPPKTDNPACANYQGTSTYSPSYLSGCGGNAPVTTTDSAIAGGPKSADAGPTTSPVITGAGAAVTSTVTLVAANSTATFTVKSSFSNSTAALSTSTSTATSDTPEVVSTTPVITPTGPTSASTAATSSSTGAAAIMTVGMNVGGLIMAAGMGAMAML